MRYSCFLVVLLALSIGAPAPAIIITEVMYHPAADETRYEWVEIYNETAAKRDLSGWRFTNGIDYTFADGTVLGPHNYLVIAADPATIAADFSITNVVGPFAGRLDNDSDHIILRDNADGIMTEVDYRDDGQWPPEADGAGYSLVKDKLRFDSMDADNWRRSAAMGGSPGFEKGASAIHAGLELIAPDENWRYFKGMTEASSPHTAWRQLAFNDLVPGWSTGQTGIGDGDGDDNTVLNDMLGGYVAFFCRKVFSVSEPAAIEQLTLEIDHDDGFVAYLNGVEVHRANMPLGDIRFNWVAMSHEATAGGGSLTRIDLTPHLALLNEGINSNILAVQVHNTGLFDDDSSFIPRLVVTSSINDPAPVVINEVHFNTATGQFIELLNTGGAAIDIGGYHLSNDADNLTRHQIPAPRTIPAGGRTVIQESDLGFSLNPAGDTIFLSNSSGGSVIDAHVVEAGPAGMSEGRYPDGGDDWHYMTPSSGAPNAVSLQTAVVINELMHHPQSNNDDHEFLELYNTGATAVDLTGWRLSRGVDFNFPAGTTIGSYQYLVVAKNRTALIALHGLNPALVLGDYSGVLNNRGEKIRLRDANNNVADEVRYYDGGRWSKYADGYGSSLELIDPRQDNNNPQAWAPSDETGQAQWQFITYSGVVRTNSLSHLHELHMRLMGKGEILVDDVQLTYNSTNYVANGSFESGLGPWLAAGTHQDSDSIAVPDAPDGARCLRITALGRGDTGPNHIEVDSQIPMPDNRTYTLSFWAKWQWGNRVLVTNCWDHELLETHILNVPTATGTPGAQNSVWRANQGPVFSDVAHSPVIPSAADSPHLTVKVHDPDSITNVTLSYKADADGAYATTPMFDDGAHNDGAAGDGLYGGDVPSRANGQTVAFYFTATDQFNASNTWPTDIALPALYRVESAPLSSNFATHRIIMTASDDNLLFNGRPTLSNYPLNCTFIFNETDVYYNCGTRLTGSPFHRRNGYSGYKVKFNADDKLHGYRMQVRDDRNPGGPYNDRASYDLQRWMGLPHCLLEYVLVRRNATSQNNYEDTIHPSSRVYLDTFYPGDNDGPLFELNDRFRFTDPDDLLYSFNSMNATMDWMGADKDPYRDYYCLRYDDNNDDFTSFVTLIDVFNNTPAAQYESVIREHINIEQWFKLMAVRTAISDWDFIGARRGKNCYVFWPLERKKWDLLGWDSELTFESGNVNMSIWSQFSDVLRFQQSPRHRHFYFHYLHELITNHFNNAKMDPWFDHYFSLVGDNPSESKNFVAARGPILMAQMPPAPPCAIQTNGGNPFTATQLSVVLEGDAPVQVRWVRVDGVEYYLDWTNATKWIFTLPLEYGVHSYSLEFLDYNRNVVCTDSIAITAPPPPPEYSYLRVTELHYNPEPANQQEKLAGHLNNDDFEFIELLNTGGAATLNLTNIRFTGGIRVDLTTATVTSLAPGQRALLARNPAAFDFRYGPGLPVIGRYSGSLDNGGEQVQFIDANDKPIQTFTYDDEGAWRWEPDGYGPSLEVIDTAGDYNSPFNWRAAPLNHGTPGTDTIVPPMTDERRFLRLVEMHYHPADPTTAERAAGFLDDGDFEFVELTNISTTATLDLSAVRFTGGIRVDLTTGSITTLPPGASVLAVSNWLGFRQRYGTDHPVLGYYGGQFSNGGEPVRLVDSENAPIHSYIYGDRSPWPEAADGAGPSLEVIDTEGDYNSPFNWRASAVNGGDPAIIVEQELAATRPYYWTLY